MISTLEQFQLQANQVKVTLEGSSKVLRDAMVNDATSWYVVDSNIQESKEQYRALCKDRSGHGGISGTTTNSGGGGGGSLSGVDWTTGGDEIGGGGGGEPVFYDAAGSGRQIKRSKNRGTHNRGYGRH